MLLLQPHHIVDLYVWIDNSLPMKDPTKGGRPSIISDNELVTLLIWNVLVLHHKTLKDIHSFTKMYLDREFPILPHYKSFVKQCHRVLPHMLLLLRDLLQNKEPLRFIDSTMLPVCTNHRSDTHKVAREWAKYGKNHQGWHYGFKLHMTTNTAGQICSFSFSSASRYDAQELPCLLNKDVKTVVGDTLYGASVMRRIIHEAFGTVIISPPWPKQKRKMATPFQNFLLSERSRIESVFGILKTRLNLVTSFPRSVFGYFVHYIRILLGYQIIALLRG